MYFQLHKKGGSKREVVLEDYDEGLTSTWQHQLCVWTTTGLLAALVAKGAAEVHDLQGAAIAGSAIVASYFLADFGTGVYHWGVDNYGSGATPIVGSQIAAFQGHHQRPWTITEREFCNNVHKVFKPALPFAAACLAVSPWTPGTLDIFLGSFVFLACMSQQFHAWSHMKKSELPKTVIALQDAGLLISRKAHGAHHKAPFEGNYCIVSGFWNPILDMDGSNQGFFRRLERFFHDRTGVEPRCWHEPTYDYQEEKPAA
ncbi:hypothetical protein WJX72_006755 [[Myrmecia] bisecta]|uniref:Lipid desaturase domain-containing protein n=1 Tax=[Myrmecia] bisecta TaxID=41462 RepID=A0AAW1PF27_9CHLO